MESKTIAEIKIGDRASLTRIITKDHVEQFALITGDYNPIHVDPDFAKKSIFKKQVAHGALSLGHISAVLGTLLPGLGTIALEISTKFLKPVYFGDTITSEVEVVNIYEKRNMVKLKLAWTNQNEELVCKGETLVLAPTEKIITSQK